MNDRLTCRNACLIEIVCIRRATRKLLDARGSGTDAHVIPCVMNINHSLNAIERELEKCRAVGGKNEVPKL